MSAFRIMFALLLFCAVAIAQPNPRAIVPPVIDDPPPRTNDVVKLAWTAVTNVQSYRIYYGVAPGVYTNFVPTVKPNVAVSNLNSSAIYWFAVSAFSITGKESAMSAPVSNAPWTNQVVWVTAEVAGGMTGWKNLPGPVLFIATNPVGAQNFRLVIHRTNAP